MFKKGQIMEVFGQEYDLSNCTEEERNQVEEWYEKNKDADVPSDNDNGHRQYNTEGNRGIMNPVSDELDIVMAIESLKPNYEWKSKLIGKPASLELYVLVHPLGAHMRVEDAAAKLGINKVTAYRRLLKLAETNPKTYDLHKWPTKAQLDVYRLIHPDLGGLTYSEAAKALGSTYQHVADLLCRMRRTHKAAFAFERLHKRPKIVSYNPAIHEGNTTEKF
jgi:hypothetical protein